MELITINIYSMDTPTTAAPQAKSNKVWWILAAIVLIGVIVAINNVDKKSGDSADMEKDATSSDMNDEATENDKISTSPAAKLVVSNDADLALPYTSAFTKYAGRRVQFDSRCAASPKSTTFANGTKIMLDNRSSVAHRITVGNKAFDIGAYNFTFLTLEAKTSSTTYSVDCADAKGVATITVTK